MRYIGPLQYEKSNLYRPSCRYRLLFYLFHRFFHRIPAAEDNLDVLIGIYLDAFHHLTDDAVIEFVQQIVAQILREYEGAISIVHILAQKALLIMELFFTTAEPTVSLLCDILITERSKCHPKSTRKNSKMPL